MIEPFGEFECPSGALVVSDPAYEYAHYAENPGIVRTLRGAATGRWLAAVDARALRLARDPEPAPQAFGLVVRSAGAPEALTWEEIETSMCFDTTQIGVFDLDFYARTPWKARVPGIAAGQLGGLLPFGASCSIPYDGWRCAVDCARDGAGRIVGVRTRWYSLYIEGEPLVFEHVRDGRRFRVTIAAGDIEVRPLDAAGAEDWSDPDLCRERSFTDVFYGGAEVLDALELAGPTRDAIVALARQHGFWREDA